MSKTKKKHISEYDTAVTSDEAAAKEAAKHCAWEKNDEKNELLPAQKMMQRSWTLISNLYSSCDWESGEFD